jgi:hypothetical protein
MPDEQNIPEEQLPVGGKQSAEVNENISQQPVTENELQTTNNKLVVS